MTTNLMQLIIQAAQTSCHEENGVLVVAFRGPHGETGTEEYLILQRTMNPSADDVRLGMDAPYLEISDQARGEYGVTKTVELRKDSLRLVILEAASDEIGAAEIEVRFPPQDHEKLSSALALVFRGSDFRRVAT